MKSLRGNPDHPKKNGEYHKTFAGFLTGWKNAWDRRHIWHCGEDVEGKSRKSLDTFFIGFPESKGTLRKYYYTVKHEGEKNG
ncbi:MAG: hypothetical protein U9R24_03995 [Thermodesulfobacteriota bacterium]|nr:hypothetical protein [Thermodesulfobacteriota bacterium]